VNWATTQNNLGNALASLGIREDSPDRLEQVVTAFTNALDIFTRDAMPYQWAPTTENLALALGQLFTRTANPDHLTQALTHITAALEVYETAGASYKIQNATRLRDHLRALRDT
jgi:hypothetical protein